MKKLMIFGFFVGAIVVGLGTKNAWCQDMMIDWEGGGGGGWDGSGLDTTAVDQVVVTAPACDWTTGCYSGSAAQDIYNQLSASRQVYSAPNSAGGTTSVTVYANTSTPLPTNPACSAGMASCYIAPLYPSSGYFGVRVNISFQ